jgi:uncharacterized hydrophobic protein (TIGR00271 family)
MSESNQQKEKRTLEDASNQSERVIISATTFWQEIGEWFRDLTNLEEGLDREGTVVTIKSGKVMRGANVWLLMCSIMVASLGLDLGSPAVIIGAMLISPLMAPILGVGLAVGINDRRALFLALSHFSVAVTVAIITSTFYFLITPLGEITPEIESRTAPTFLDGLVAVFGGIAGIISTSRKEKSSAIPGVAIATALMPPLCVTGYGLATGNWQIALNSFYLFFLNSFFIAVSTFVIVRLLRFPFKEKLDKAEGRRTRWILTLFSMLITIPSTIILYDLWAQRQETRKVEQFVESHFGTGSKTVCLGYSLIRQDTSKQLVLQLLGRHIPEDSMVVYRQDLRRLGLDNVNLSLIQDADVGLDELDRLRLQISSMGQLAEKLEATETARTQQQRVIEELSNRRSQVLMDSMLFADLGKEVQTLFPAIDELRFARMQKTNFQDSIVQMPTYLVHWQTRRSTSARRRDEEKLREFFKVRTKFDTLELISY